MSLKLYYHPLSSFCWKALAALYEGEVPFEPVMVNLGDPADRAMLGAIWPFTRFPVLSEGEGGPHWPEATILIERLAQTYPLARGLVPPDEAEALKVRLMDRTLDLYVHEQMQRVVANRIRPAEAKDAMGADQARGILANAYDLLERTIPATGWACGETFTLADCAAAPALFYGHEVQPFMDSHPNLAAYLGRLKARPSVARVLTEAEPYMHMFPRD